jgi:hypothetical protein
MLALYHSGVLSFLGVVTCKRESADQKVYAVIRGVHGAESCSLQNVATGLKAPRPLLRHCIDT